LFKHRFRNINIKAYFYTTIKALKHNRKKLNAACKPLYAVIIAAEVQNFIFSHKPVFHDADTDILAGILADTSDPRDCLKLFLWQAERNADILVTIIARMSVCVSVSAS